MRFPNIAKIAKQAFITIAQNTLGPCESEPVSSQVETSVSQDNTDPIEDFRNNAKWPENILRLVENVIGISKLGIVEDDAVMGGVTFDISEEEWMDFFREEISLRIDDRTKRQLTQARVSAQDIAEFYKSAPAGYYGYCCDHSTVVHQKKDEPSFELEFKVPEEVEKIMSSLEYSCG